MFFIWGKSFNNRKSRKTHRPHHVTITHFQPNRKTQSEKQEWMLSCRNPTLLSPGLNDWGMSQKHLFFLPIFFTFWLFLKYFVFCFHVFNCVSLILVSLFCVFARRTMDGWIDGWTSHGASFLSVETATQPQQKHTLNYNCASIFYSKTLGQGSRIKWIPVVSLQPPSAAPLIILARERPACMHMWLFPGQNHHTLRLQKEDGYRQAVPSLFHLVSMVWFLHWMYIFRYKGRNRKPRSRMVSFRPVK